MNPTDPNQPEQPQPEQPAPEAPQTPFEPTSVPVEVSVPEAPVAPVEQPTPEASQSGFGASSFGTPAPTEAPAANPFGAPVSSDAPVNPFAAAAAPVAPAIIGSSPNSDPLPTPGGKSKKKLIILISAIVGALIVLGGAALAVYFIFFNVTHADYQKAYDQVSALRDKYSAGDSISSGSSKDTVDAAKTAYADFKTENAKLGDLKALKVDKDLNAKYKAYDTKAKAYIAFGDVFMPSLDRFVAANDQVAALGSGSSSFTSVNIQKTIDIYKGIQDIGDPTLKAFVDSTVAVYEEILPQIKIYESSSSTSSQKYAAISAISDSSKKISTAGSKMSDDLDAKTKDVSLSDTLNSLGQAVTDKLNKK
jgi:hypothetical protein